MNRLNQIFYDLKERRIERREANERGLKIEELKKYCISKKVGFFPVLMEELPQFSGTVEDYISENARKDLSPNQFIPEFIRKEPCSLLELGGVLGYKVDCECLHVFAYHRPENGCDDRVFDNPLELTRDMVAVGKIKPDDSIDSMVSWHSQPVGPGELTEGDLESIRDVIGTALDRPCYHVIYIPRENRFFWYGFEKTDLTAAPEEPKGI